MVLSGYQDAVREEISPIFSALEKENGTDPENCMRMPINASYDMLRKTEPYIARETTH